MNIRIFLEYIKHENGKYNVYSHTGKHLGSYSSRKQAQHRLKQIEYFKHLNEGEEILDKPTLSPEQLAKLHNVSVEVINNQIAKGMKIEQEHTSNLQLAKEIASDHIREKVDYYDRLEKVEK